jgi:hypothetical protein
MVDIPRDVAESEGVPGDLDSRDVGPYSVPSPRRRRSAGMFYLAAAALIALGALAGLPGGFWVVAGGIAAIGAYHFAAAWDLVVREGEALEIANRAVPFGVGHASAQLAFEGWRARPVWHLLVFSDDEPPTNRGLVRVSPLNGDVIDAYTEEVPSA